MIGFLYKRVHILASTCVLFCAEGGKKCESSFSSPFHAASLTKKLEFFIG